MRFYRHIVRGLIGVGFCALFAGCGAADPEESGEVDVSETEAATSCTGTRLFVCVISGSSSLNGRCCNCNGVNGTLRPDPISPGFYKCKT